MSVRPGSRSLRVDILNRRIAPAQAVYEYFRSRPGTILDTVTLDDHDAVQAAAAVLEGRVDATFRSLPAGQVPTGVRAERLLDTPLQVLVGPDHSLAGRAWLWPADLVGVGDWYLWPESYGLRHLPLRDPTPVYLHVLLSRAGDQHPVLGGLRAQLRARRPEIVGEVWGPD